MKIWTNKNFCIIWLLFGVGFLSVVFQVLLIVNYFTPILHLLVPNFCPMIMPCVLYSIVFSYKINLAKKYFSKASFPKKLIEVCTASAQLRAAKIFPKIYLTPIRYRIPRNHKNIILKVIFLFYLKAF